MGMHVLSINRSWTAKGAAVAGLVLAIVVMANPWVPASVGPGSAAIPNAGPAALGHAPPALTSPPTLRITDRQSLSTVLGGHHSVLNDVILPGVATTSLRTYLVRTTTLVSYPLVMVNLTTRPVFGWAHSGDFPGGPDNLPSLSSWTWSVTVGSHSDTSNWTTVPGTNLLTRVISWSPHTYTITGVPSFTAHVAVDPSKLSGLRAAGGGFEMSEQIAATDHTTLPLARPLHPSIVRWSQVYDAPATWHSGRASASFSWIPFSGLMNFSRSLGAPVLVSLPAGSWGDGNLLPAGMPLNTSLLINWYGHSTGYYPDPAAYGTYVKTFAQGVKAHGWTIAYWNIGNEVPVWISNAYANAFPVVFNAGAKAIHAVFPRALVGSDVLTAPGHLAHYATVLRGVGFLGFHVYPAGRLCPTISRFCIPNNVNGYLTDSAILKQSVGLSKYWEFVAPHLSQIEWHNSTGRWLPLINEETNLNSAQSHGSDPRQQTLFAAAWMVGSYITNSAQNVTHVVTYSLVSSAPLPAAPTKRYGGWGFGLANITPQKVVSRYSQYWAMSLWNSATGPGGTGLSATSDKSYVVPVFAVANGTGFNLVIANQGAVAARIHVRVVSGSYTATTLKTLDDRSYRMVFNQTTRTEQLLSSGIQVTRISAQNLTVTLDGYGVAVLVYASGGHKVAARGPSPQIVGPMVVGATGSFEVPTAIAFVWTVSPVGASPPQARASLFARAN